MTAAAVALPAHWQRWHWSAAISPGNGIVTFSVPPQIDGRARADLADLRLIDDHGSEAPFEIATRLRRAHPVLQRYAVQQRISQRGSQTLVTVDGTAAHLPASFLRLASGTRRFSRHVTLEYSDDGRIWSTAAQARFERTARLDRRTLSFPEKRAHYWRLTIENGNDAPLTRPLAELWGAPRYVVFESDAPHRYRVLFGNRAATDPSYDFAAAHAGRPLDPSPVFAGAPQENPAFVPAAAPWTESHPWVLWGALAAAVAGIGGLALRVLTLK